MKVPIALVVSNALITWSLLSVVCCRDQQQFAEVVESSPRNIFHRKSFRFPTVQMEPMPSRTMMDKQYWVDQVDRTVDRTVDPNINSLAKINQELVFTLNRLEMKFDRILDKVNDNGEDNVNMRDIRDVMKKLNRCMGDSPENSVKTSICKCESESGEMPPNNLLRELVAAVGHSNEVIMKVETNVQQVMENGRLSIQSLEKISEIVEDINERLTRTQGKKSTMDVRHDDPIVASTKTNYKTDANGVHSRNINSYSTSDEALNADHNRMDPIATSTENNYESNESYTNDRVASTATNYNENESKALNHNRNSHKTSNEAINADHNRRDSVATSMKSNYELNESETVDRNGKSTVQGSTGTRYNENGVSNHNRNSHPTSYEALSTGYNRNDPVVTSAQNNFESNGSDIDDRNGKSAVAATTTRYNENGVSNSNNRNSHPPPNEVFSYNRKDPVVTSAQNNYESNGSDINDRNRKSNYNENDTEALNNNRNSHTTSNEALNGDHNLGDSIVTSKQSNFESNSSDNTDRKSTVATTNNNEGGISNHNRNSHITSNEAINADHNRRDPVVTSTQSNYESNEGDTIIRNGKSTVASTATKYNENDSSNHNENGASNHNRNSHSTSNAHSSQSSSISNYELNEKNTADRNGKSVVTTVTTNYESNQNSNASPTIGSSNRASNDNGMTGHAAGATTTVKYQFNENRSVDPKTTSNYQQDEMTGSSRTTSAKTASIDLNEHSESAGSGHASTTTEIDVRSSKISTVSTSETQTYLNVRKDKRGVTFEPNKRNCQDLQLKYNGIYKFASQDELANDGGRFFYERYCDFSTDNRAWTVIQRRFAKHSEQNFNRTWLDYKNGFGDLDNEFWLGNDFIHKLTSDDAMELRIIMENQNGKEDWLEYKLFKVKSEEYNYKMIIAGYTGSIPDSFLYHNGQLFSTFDRRNDNGQDLSCASSIGYGWWYRNCTEGVLGNWLVTKATKMLIRPRLT